MGNNVTIFEREESIYRHDEAEITVISYLLEATRNGKNTVRVITDDTDIFILLIFSLWRLQMTAGVQLDRRHGAFININESSFILDAKSHQLLRCHAAILCPIHFGMAKR